MTGSLQKVEKITIRFHVANDEVLLAQLAGPGGVEFNEVAHYRVAEMKANQKNLASKLEAYQDEQTIANLRALVEEGYLAYCDFLRGFDEGETLAREWWKCVIAERRRVSPPILELTVLDRLTIPFGLFYVVDPKNIQNWEEYENVIDGFIGMNFPLHKLYQRRRRLPRPMTQLCRGEEFPRILHSMDRLLPNAKREQENWPQLKGQVTTPSKKDEVVANWINVQTPPHLVHCSCHLIQDSQGRGYLSCGQNERIYIREFDETSLDYPPFVFLNSCNGGVISYDDRDNFVWQLFPRVASGFVATTCKVTDSLAAEIAKYFYRYFAGGAEVLSSLHQSIQFVARERRNLGALAYVLWESDPSLRLRA